MLSSRTERRRMVGLDILRGIAAYAVVISHCYSPIGVIFHRDLLYYGEFLGRLGVETFFALSGFLIGGVLLKLVVQQRSKINFFIFLVRRWMRTLPIYYVAMAIYVTYPAIFEPGPPHSLLSYLTFTQNVFQGNADFFRVSWSLSIEEWFYILLPACVFVGTALAPSSRGFLLGVLAIMLLGFALRLIVVPVDNHAIVSRIDAIAYGCLLAYLVSRDRIVTAMRRHAFTISVVSAMLFIVLVAIEQNNGWVRHRAVIAALYSAIPFAAAGSLCAFVFWEPVSSKIVKVASFSAAVSYPVYVLHNEVIVAFDTGLVNPGTGIVNLAFVIVTSTAFAYIAHTVIEAPFMRWRPRFVEGPAVITPLKPAFGVGT